MYSYIARGARVEYRLRKNANANSAGNECSVLRVYCCRAEVIYLKYFGRNGGEMVHTLMHEALHDTSRWHSTFGEAHSAFYRNSQAGACGEADAYHQQLAE